MFPREFLNLDFPDERRSTCMDCPKVLEEKWRKDFRCCTYHPRVPNFALGLALHTDDGKRAITAAKKLGVLIPEGMNHSPNQYVDYLDDLEDDLFGKSQRVLCPMLERSNGFCNIHAFRNSVCSTFFCTKDHGSIGDKFWEAVQVLGAQVEIALSQWCLTELGFSIHDYIDELNGFAKKMDQVCDPNSRGFSENALKRFWGKFYGREFELYKRCAELVSDHRDYLWEIANEAEIIDAKKYDQANLKHVPKRLAHQIDEEDWDDDGDAIKPQDLWDKCAKLYQRIWKIPDHELVINPRAALGANNQESSLDQKYQDRPFQVTLFERRQSKKVDDRIYLSPVEYDMLKGFEESRSITWRFLADPKWKKHPSPKRFLAELSQKKILIKTKAP